MVGENITITCVTADSAFMAWSSNEYIGQGLRLEYSFRNLSGSILKSLKHPATFANLTSKFNINPSGYILESQLHIMVLVDYPQFNVTCHNPGHDLMKSITFVVGKSLQVDPPIYFHATKVGITLCASMSMPWACLIHLIMHNNIATPIS